MTDFFRIPVKDDNEFWAKVNESTRKGITRDEKLDLYNKWAESFDMDMTAERYPIPVIGAKTVAKLLQGKKDAHILDVGAGTGLLGKHLRDLGFYNLDALDGCATMLEKAREKGVYKRMICNFLGPNKLDIQNDTYDVVVASGSFTEGNCKSDCFPEIIRILKPGSHFILVDGAKYIPKDISIGLESHEQQGHWMIKRETESYEIIKDSILIYVLTLL